jgi:tetratricopeptide (TPR) repeat protein
VNQTTVPAHAPLAEERDFLLASLADLDAEREAGDIDDADYQALRDDYTRRAAAVLRAMEADAAAPAAAPAAPAAPAPPATAAAALGRRRWPVPVVVFGLAVVGLGAAWAVTASSGSRLANQPITGTFAGRNAPGGTQAPSPGVDPRLLQAGQLVSKGKVADALKLYDQVLKDRPNDPEALANEGWLIAQAGVAASRPELVDQGLTKLQAAERADSSYPTAHFFRGYLLFKVKGDAAGAVPELRQYLGMVDPSSPEVPQVQQVLQAALAAAGLPR